MTPSCPNGSPRPQRFAPAMRAKPAEPMPKAAEARPASCKDPYGLLRLERSRARTHKGFKRLANAVTRETIGIPLTRAQQAEKRAQRPKLDPNEIDKNAYRAPVVRERSPRDMPRRRSPGWAAVNFVLPRRTIEGLKFLARGIADRERAERSSEPHGFKRRYPRTKNYFVVQALNYLFQEHGISQFCVAEAKPIPSRVRRFVVLTD
jgi:hypothetical protein